MTENEPAARLPAEARQALRARAAELADLVVGRAADVPDPATRRNLRIGAQAAVERFVDRMAGRDHVDLELFVAHGRAQRAAGRSLAELLGFYRRGGAAIWEAAADVPAVRALAPETLVGLGSSVMGWVDELSGAAVEGFSAQEAASRAAERARRDHLAALLLGAGGPTGAPAALEAAADAAGWPLPERLRAALGAVGDPAAAAGSVPSRVLVTEAPGHGGRVLLLVADDGEVRDWTLRAARALGLAWPVALGPAVAPGEAAASARRAGALLDLVLAGLPGSDPELPCSDDHEVDLLLAAEPELAAALAARRLRALDDLAPAPRARMEATLRAWLATPDRPQAMADALGLHVQTVRYRLAKLRERLGDALDDPADRLELALALRARDALAPPDSRAGGSG